MTLSLVEDVTIETELDSKVVNTVTESFAKHLHKRSYEHDASKSSFDYLTGGLHADVSDKILYHTMGMLIVYLERSGADEVAIASILHSLELLAPKKEWQPYIDEMQSWTKGY
tara:strand:+ start:1892 stop:2230 length:339 start_codon:yes stop_codon:yes gene_type:complete